MARHYDVTFETPTGYEVTRGQGNTKRVAERSARRKLREKGFDPTLCLTMSIRHVKDAN